jgi:hypothetical protein
MKYIQLFENFINENNQKKIEKAADKWWKDRMKKYDSWEAEDMDMFMDYLMDEELVDYDDEDLEEVRSDMEQYVENTLGYEFNG